MFHQLSYIVYSPVDIDTIIEIIINIIDICERTSPSYNYYTRFFGKKNQENHRITNIYIYCVIESIGSLIQEILALIFLCMLSVSI